MKKILKLVAVATFVCLMSTSGLALTINDTGVVGIIENPFNQNAEVDNVTEWANYLLGLVAPDSGFADADGDGSDEYYMTGPTEYSGTLTDGLRIDGATPTDLDMYEYVLGKYDGQNAGWVLFNMAAYGGDSIPEFSDDLWTNRAGEGYQLSNVTVFGAAPVPEPGTIVLMGLGLVGLAGMGRKRLFKK